jgi:hypothetical protein
VTKCNKRWWAQIVSRISTKWKSSSLNITVYGVIFNVRIGKDFGLKNSVFYIRTVLTEHNNCLMYIFFHRRNVFLVRSLLFPFRRMWKGCLDSPTYWRPQTEHIYIYILTLWFYNMKQGNHDKEQFHFISATVCGLQYVGESKQPFHIRLNGNRSDLTKKTFLPVSQHSRLSDHSLEDFNKMKILIIEHNCLQRIGGHKRNIYIYTYLPCDFTTWNRETMTKNNFILYLQNINKTLTI